MNKKAKDIVIAVLTVAFIVAIQVIRNPIVDAILGTCTYLSILVLLVFLLRNKIKYRNGGMLEEIRFPTQNDTSYKVFSLMVGALFIIGTPVWVYFQGEGAITEYAFVPIGVLLLANGLLHIPTASLSIEDSKITLNGKQVSVNEVESIFLAKDKVVIHKTEDENLKVDFLELNEEWIARIKKFVNQKLSNRIVMQVR